MQVLGHNFVVFSLRSMSLFLYSRCQPAPFRDGCCFTKVCVTSKIRLKKPLPCSQRRVWPEYLVCTSVEAGATAESPLMFVLDLSSTLTSSGPHSQPIPAVRDTLPIALLFLTNIRLHARSLRTTSPGPRRSRIPSQAA